MTRTATYLSALLGIVVAAALSAVPAAASGKNGKGPGYRAEHAERQDYGDDRRPGNDRRGNDDDVRYQNRQRDDRQPPADEAIERWWRELPEAEQQRLMRDYDRYRKLEPAKRDHLGNRWQRFRDLPPDQQDKLRKHYQRWQKLPPGEQERLQRTWRRYQELPAGQREQLKKELRDLRNLPDAERERQRQELHRRYFPDLPAPAPGKDR